jgi:HSP20 family protein
VSAPCRGSLETAIDDMKTTNAMKTTVQTEKPETSARAEQQEYILPQVNIFEEENGYSLEAEMPGVSKDGLEVQLEGNELTILGHRHDPKYQGEVIFRESQDADYRRVFELDPTIDTSRIVAKMDQGVLMVTLPKSEAIKPRRIKINE